MMIYLRTAFIVVIVGAATVCFGATPEQIDQARAKGLAWLISNQKGGGNWGTSSGLEVQSTASAVEALLNAGINHGYTYAAGVSWLQNADALSVDSLSRKIIALKSAGANVTADLNRLLSYKNSTYTATWGAYDKYGTSYPDTPMSLSAIRRSQYSYSNQDYELLNALYCTVLPAQKPDGSWPYMSPLFSSGVLNAPGAIIPTAYLTMELQAIKNTKGWNLNYCGGTVTSLSSGITNGINWLLSNKNADGGFGENGKSSALETLLVYNTLVDVGSSDPSKTAAFDYLISKQDASGSWDNDPFVTSLVLKALPMTVLSDYDKDGIPDNVEAVLGTNPVIADARTIMKGGGESEIGSTAPTFLASGTVCQPFSKTLTVAGGRVPYTWTLVTGSLPSGLTLNNTSGVISGTPIAAGTSNFTYRVLDADNTSISVVAQIQIQAPSSSASMTINNGAAVTKSTTTSLALNNGGTTYSSMKFSNDSGAWSTPAAFAGTKSWLLDSGDGLKTVCGNLTRADGSVSAVVDTITLDTFPPTVYPIPDAGIYPVSSLDIRLQCSDSSTSCSQIYYTLDGTNPATSSSSYDSKLTLAAGVTRLRYFGNDAAGNSSSITEKIFALDKEYQWTSDTFGDGLADSCCGLAVGKYIDTSTEDYSYTVGNIFDEANFQVNTVVAVHDSHGQLVKTYSYNFGADSFPVGIVQDTSNNIYVGGQYWDPTYTTSGYFILKYNPNATGTAPVWVRKLTVTGSRNAWPDSIAIDSTNHVYMSGTLDGGDFLDTFTTKYAADGTLNWKFTYNPGSNDFNQVNVGVDSSGNIYLAGYVIDWGGDGPSQLMITKLSSARVKLWDISVPTQSTRYVYPTMTVAGDNSLVVATSINDVFELIRYDGSGNQIMRKIIDDSPTTSGYLTNIVERNGYVYFAGRSGNDSKIWKYDAAGALVFKKTYVNPNNDLDKIALSKNDPLPKFYLSGPFIPTNWGDPAVTQYINPSPN